MSAKSSKQRCAACKKEVATLEAKVRQLEKQLSRANERCEALTEENRSLRAEVADFRSSRALRARLGMH